MENSEPTRSTEQSALTPQPARIFPWKKAWQTLKAIWPQLVYISLLCMSIPQYFLFYISSRTAAALAPKFAINNPISFDNSLDILRQFGIQYLGYGTGVALLFVLGCFTIVSLCIQEIRLEPITTSSAFKSALRTLLPHGVIFLALALLGSIALLNIAVQIAPPSLIRFLGMVMCVLVSAMPVLMVLDAKRPWKVFKKAISLDYVSFTGMSKWSVFFLLLTYELLALNAIALVEWISGYVNEIDSALNISREAVFSTSSFFPFGKLIWVTEALYSIGFALTTAAFLVLNVTFIYELYRRNSLGRTISISA